MCSMWDRLYAGTLGLVDNISSLPCAMESSIRCPSGASSNRHTKLWAPEMYVQDVLANETLSYSLPRLKVTVGRRLPFERLGRQTIQIDAGTGKPITALEFLKQRKMPPTTANSLIPLSVCAHQLGQKRCNSTWTMATSRPAWLLHGRLRAIPA